MHETDSGNSGHGGGRDDHGRKDAPLPVTVRTLAGYTRHDKVRPSERIQDVTAESVRFFVARRELIEGDYALTLPRLGNAELDPTGTIAELGVVRDDVLVLVCWGALHYGRLNGLLSAPAVVATAIAPWAGAALARVFGGYAPVFMGLAGLALLAAGCAAGSVPGREGSPFAG